MASGTAPPEPINAGPNGHQQGGLVRLWRSTHEVPSKVLRPLTRVIRPLTKAKLPPLPDLTELVRPSRLAQRLRASAIAQRLRHGLLAERLLPNPAAELPSPGRGRSDDQEVERPREVDLPEAVVQADGLPIHCATVVAVPVEIAYNQFTQFEDFPGFMRTIARAEQLDAAQVEFELRRGVLRHRWKAQIVDQRPDERIAWRSVSGMRLAGVTSFHSIGDRLTRIDASVVVEPTGGLQRMARRLRLVDRAIADELRRFKAFLEMREEETGAWRGYIADGEVVDEDDYFGWEPAEEGGEDMPAARDAEAPDGEALDEGASVKGSRSGSRSTGAASNGASAETAGIAGTSAEKSGSSGAGRTRTSEESGGSRSRA